MITADVLESMRRAGISADQIVQVAIDAMRQAEGEEQSRVAERRKRDRERKRDQREAKQLKSNNRVRGTEWDNAESVGQKESSPHTPLKEKEPSKKNPPKGGQKESSHEFEELWKAWPAIGRRRSGIPKASAAYLKARKCNTHAEIMRGVALYLASPEPGEHQEMTPGLHRWLNDCKHEAWLDDGGGEPVTDWAGEVKLFADWGDWRPEGPAPGQPGCKAPAEVQREHGFEPIAEKAA